MSVKCEFAPSTVFSSCILCGDIFFIIIFDLQHYISLSCTAKWFRFSDFFSMLCYSVQFSSVTQTCPTLCDPMDCSTPGFPVHHQLPELAQTHVHWVSYAIQLSHPVLPFSSCLQSFPASGSFPMSQCFASRGQSIGVSASPSVLPMNIQDWFPLGLTGWITLQTKGLSRVFSNTQYKSIKSSALSFLYSPTLTSIHDYWKTIALIRRTFVSKVMSLLFNMLPRLVRAFLPRSKYLLISWLQSPSGVILEPKKIKSVTLSIVSPSIRHEVMEPDTYDLSFWMLNFKPAVSLSSFTFIKRLFSSSSLSALRVLSSAYLRLLIFFLVILIPACASSRPAFHMRYSHIC